METGYLPIIGGEIRGDPSGMAAALGRTLDEVMLVFFPLITRRLRSDQDHWINEVLEKMIQGRSKSWKKVKKKMDQIIRERKHGYLDYQVVKAQENRNRFASLTKPLQCVHKEPNLAGI